MIRALSGKIFTRPKNLEMGQNSDDEELPSPTGMIIQASSTPSGLGTIPGLQMSHRNSITPAETSPKTTPFQPSPMFPSSPKSMKSRMRSGSVVLRKLERSLSVKSISSARRQGSFRNKSTTIFSTDDTRQSDHEGGDSAASLPAKSGKTKAALLTLSDIGKSLPDNFVFEKNFSDFF